MHIGDLKRAVEDVILRPDDNPISDMERRSTIAALDLCQVREAQRVLPHTSNSRQRSREQTCPMLTSSLCSGEVFSSTESTCSTSLTASTGVYHHQQVPTNQPPPLSMSTSLDTMVLRQTLSNRPSLGTSRRSSRVLPHYGQSKRKRSNSVSSCMNKNILLHGMASTAGISATTAGGASALSLAPATRSLRFGDSEEYSSGRSTSGGIPSPIPYTTGLTEPILEIGLHSQQQQLLSSCEGLSRRQQTNVEAGGGLLPAVANNSASKLSSAESFTAFRTTHNLSDQEEQMECD